MQKINGNSGVTLLTLVITIIVMIILAGTALTTGYQSLNNTTDNIKYSDAQMIQQAVRERGYLIDLHSEDTVKVYNVTYSAAGTAIYNENEKPKLYLGYPLYSDAEYIIDDLKVNLDASSTEKNAENTVSMKNIVKIFDEYNHPEYFSLKGKVEEKNEETIYDELYYVLDRPALTELGIDNIADIYVVNYKTGEIFNWSMKEYRNGELVYLAGEPNTIDVNPDSTNAVTENVNAW